MPKLNLKALAAIGAGLIILVLLALLYMARADNRELVAKLDAAEQRHIAFAERVKAKAEEIQRRALERARRVEAEQDRINQEISHDYEAQLAALRARYERLLAGPAGANPGGSGSAPAGRPVPGGAGGAARPSGEGGLSPASPATWLTLRDAFICTKNSMMLVGWQRWYREQRAIDREAMPAEAQSTSQP